MRETPKAKQAFNDYLALGPERSLEKLAGVYLSRTESVPTRQLSRLKVWSTDYGWQSRLENIAKRTQEAIEKKGVADKQYRMNIINQTVERLTGLIEARANDVNNKAVGREQGLVITQDVSFTYSEDGEETVRVEKYATDGVVLKELREYLKHAAQEMGQWTEKKELTGKDGGPIATKTTIDLTRLSDEELLALERITGKLTDTAGN